MITHDEALQIILSNVISVDKEFIDLENCLNRILASDIHSDINMPPFDKSAVDGYACRKEDIHQSLQVIETIAAGSLPQKTITKGCCSKIMTGAKVPSGADTILMIEDIEELHDQTIQFLKKTTSSNICLTGEDIKKNDLVIKQGTQIMACHMGIMATVGMTKIPVSRKIKIGIITTGDELQEPGEILQEGKIRNSNAWQLIGNCHAVNSIPSYYGIVKDELNITTQTIVKALDENDMVLVTGGVSMGDFDFVPMALKQAGFEILFDSIAMQPGRPLTYATNGKKHCFGLPGNPVSSLVQFELSVKPLIYKLMGHDFRPVYIPMKTDVSITRKKTGRKSFYPVELTEKYSVRPLGYHGSAHINAFTDAFGLIAMEQGVAEIEKGEIVYVRPL